MPTSSTLNERLQLSVHRSPSKFGFGLTNYDLGCIYEQYWRHDLTEFFPARMAVEFKGRPVPHALIKEAVAHSLEEFHQYAIREDDRNKDPLIRLLAGGGKP